jgi:UDP-2,3-diacylglucosamine pyrophosphatase LpxH
VNRRRIFVISDLHLGGRPHDRQAPDGTLLRRTQITSDYRLIVQFIDWLIHHEHGKDEELELVINGDFVDFLLEDDYAGMENSGRVWPADQNEARARLGQIATRTREIFERGIFDALSEFLADGHRLTLLLGNHDVELALPKVREHLWTLLKAAGKRFQFFHDGEAYAVGRVLIEHGNRYDPWNMIDHNGLRQERSVLSRNLPVNEEQRAARFFVPPPGTYLVIKFLNKIKSRYTFVDLLKPENEAVVPLLLALEPDFRPELGEILTALELLNERRKNSLENAVTPAHNRYLTVGPRELGSELRETLGSDASSIFPSRETVPLSLRSRIADLNAWLLRSFEPVVNQIDRAHSLQKLLAAPKEEKRAVLGATLFKLNRYDRCFDLDYETAPYSEAARETARAGGFDVVVYGHTHLPKRQVLTFSGHDGVERSCLYLNTGTWCDVIRLPAPIAQARTDAAIELDRFVTALQTHDYSGYVRQYPCFAEIDVDPESTEPVRAELHGFSSNGRCLAADMMSG